MDGVLYIFVNASGRRGTPDKINVNVFKIG